MKTNLFNKICFTVLSTVFLFGCNRNIDYRNSGESEQESIYSKDEYQGLFSPENVNFRTDEKTFSWDEVKGTSYYEILIQSQGVESYSKKSIAKTSIDLSTLKSGTETVFDKFFVNNTNQVLLSVRAYTTKDSSDYSSYLYDSTSHSDSLFYTYSVNNDLESVTITGFSGHATSDNKTNLKFPNEIAGLKVSEIGENAFVSSKGLIENITLSSSIVKINNNAFSSEKTSSYPSTIKTVKFDDLNNSKLEYIGSYAFASLPNLVEFTIPDSLKTISSNAFLKCSKLATFNMGYENSKLEYIGENAFDTCRLLPVFYFSKNIKYIGKNAFSTCPKLTNVYFSKDIELENIGSYAFAKSGLTSFYLPKSVKSIDDNAFNGCTSLAAFFYDKDCSLTKIDNDAFNGCTSLKLLSSVEYNNNELRIDNGYGVTVAYFDNEVTREDVSKITISINSSKNSIFKFGSKEIGEALTSFYLNIPDSLTYIGSNAFNKSKVFTNFYVSDNSNLTYIGESCFAGAAALTEFIIPSKLEYLGKNAFNGDSKLDIFESFNTNAPKTLKYVSFDSFASTLNAPVKNKTYVINNTLISVEDSLKASNYDVSFANIKESATSASTKICSIIYIGPSVFKSSKIKSVDLTGIKEIYDEAFSSITTINSLNLVSSITYIDAKAFYGLKNVSDFDFNCTNLTYIGDSAFYSLNSSTNNQIQINVPDSLTYIGNNAFEQATNLTNFIVSDNSLLTYIGEKAFYNCKSLSSFNVSSKVKEIGTSAFEVNASSTSSLKTLNLDNASSLKIIGENAFKNTSLEGIINIPNLVETISENTFASINSNGFEIAFNSHSNIKQIKENAFDGSSLISINIPESLEVIDSYAFNDCSKLTSITFENNNINKINSNTFSGCISLETINLPDSVIEIADYAFDGCSSLNSISSKAKDISNYAFNNSYFENVFDDGFVVYNNVLIKYTGSDINIDLSKTTIEEINPQAFLNSYNLKSIVLPSTLKVIGKEAFSGCSNLESVTFDKNNVKTIGEYAFYNCNKLTSFDFTDSIESIEKFAFYNNSIKKVYVGSNLSYIGEYAFYNNFVNEIEYANDSIINLFGAYSFAYNELENITFPNQNIKLEAYSFAYSYEVKTLEIKSNINAIGYSFYNSDSITKLTCDSSKPITVIFGGNASVVPQSLKEIIIVEGNETIVDYCFAGCGSIESIDIPLSIKYIGNYSFYGCRSITSLNINNVESIGDYAFAGTTSLVLTKENLNKANVIGDYVFLSSSAIDNFTDEFVIINGNLVKVNTNKSNITFDKESPLKVIVGGAFAGNDVLKTLSIDNNVKIHSGAFDNCYNFTSLKLNYIDENNLTSIVNIELNVFDGTSNLKITVPSKLKDIYKNDIYWKLYADKIK